MPRISGLSLLKCRRKALALLVARLTGGSGPMGDGCAAGVIQNHDSFIGGE